jgi:diguanylate cyclase (GGDEF)-like protein/PAS domain S-box-containing protein
MAEMGHTSGDGQFSWSDSSAAPSLRSRWQVSANSPVGAQRQGEHVSACASAVPWLSDLRDMEHPPELMLAGPSENGPCVLAGEELDELLYGVLAVVDAELRLVLVEGPALAQHGISATSLLGRPLHEVIASTTLEALLPHLQAVFAGQKCTLELPDRDGTVNHQLTLIPWQDPEGRCGALMFSWNTAAASASSSAAETERRYRLLAESATDVVSLRDRDGIYRYVSPSATALVGYRPEGHIGRHASEFVHPDDRELVAAANARLLAGEDVVVMEYRVVRSDDSCVWVRTGARALRDPASGELTEVRTSTHDITEQRAREAELQAITAELKLRLRQTAAIAHLGELALEEPDLDRFLAEAALKVAEILTVPLCAVLVDDADVGLRVRAGTGWRAGTIGRSVVCRADADSWLRRLGHAPVIVTEPPPDPSLRRLLREHGALSSLWVVLAERDRPLGVLGVHERERRGFTDDDRTFLVAVANILRDAIARHRAEETARHDALHDALTGLANRRLLTDRLGYALARSARSGARHAVLFLDVDQFKVVNDSLGHDAGDRLLRLLGPQLCAAVRPGDTVARFGGDEFVVLCEDVRDEQHAARIARRLTDAVNRSFDLGGREHVASASIGVAVTDGTRCTPQELLRDADTAMYRAKEAGRSRFELFDAGMRQRTLARIELEDELRRALGNDELVLYYQPIHAIDDEVPAMVEALVRWQHPERGLLAPATFIPIAEETNLIVPLGAQVLRHACAQIVRWRETLPRARELALSVNVSARQLTRATFDAEVAQTLSETGLPAHALCLEITEGVLLQDSSATAETIANLRERGIRIVLDDFGTGYSSLSYLQRFSLDILKIDRSFVSGLEHRLESRVIVEAIIMMAHAFGLDVTAEGVETLEELQVLRELGCAHAQGYLLARPMPAANIETLLRDGFRQTPPSKDPDMHA